MTKKEYTTEVGDTRLSATFSDLTDQANGSVIVSLGGTAVLVTAVMGKENRDDIDYLPLVVDYEERFYAAGLLLGGRFMKREGRPSDEAILAGRLVDRTIRPLFDQSIRRDIQIVITILSVDGKNDPDIPSIIATSLALGTSDIPWGGPVGAIRISGGHDGLLSINPSYSVREGCDFDLVLCGQGETINMIEAEARETPEETIVKTLEPAIKHFGALENFQKKIIREIGKKKITLAHRAKDSKIKEHFEKEAAGKLKNAFYSGPGHDGLDALRNEWLQSFTVAYPSMPTEDAALHFEEAVNTFLHTEAIERGGRADGRKVDQVRPLFAEAGGISDFLHGVGIFYRGGTHVLSVLTLGGPEDSQIVEGMEVRTKKYFMHHYNFPPFSSGETGRLGGTNRRAVGHGALVEKALKAVIPDRISFPYTIRLVSESMASNGSTSMASVCASSLALIDGGVPLKTPVAGVAMGLAMENSSRYQILSDIQGPEDHHGDMDFKVAGTKEGITALQLDVKVSGIPVKILAEALTQAKEARTHILSVMTEAVKGKNFALKPSAPRVERITIDPDKIGFVIGPGGRTINQLSEETGATVNVEQDGTVFVMGGKDAVLRAKDEILSMTRTFTPGDRMEGTVVKLFDFGAVVRLSPYAEGLVHISELAPFRVEKVTDIVCEGEKVPVMVKDIDERGRLSLSIVKAEPNFAQDRGPKVCPEPETTHGDDGVGYNKKNGRHEGGEKRYGRDRERRGH